LVAFFWDAPLAPASRFPCDPARVCRFRPRFVFFVWCVGAAGWGAVRRARAGQGQGDTAAASKKSVAHTLTTLREDFGQLCETVGLDVQVHVAPSTLKGGPPRKAAKKDDAVRSTQASEPARVYT